MWAAWTLTASDRPVSNEIKTFIERDIMISPEDAQAEMPFVWIEQRIYEAGSEKVVARKLSFPEQLVAGRVYVFKECGDHIHGQGRLPDLHFTAREVRNHHRAAAILHSPISSYLATVLC